MRGQVERFIALYGRTVTLVRPSGATAEVPAFIRRYDSDTLPGTAVRQGAREVRIAAAALEAAWSFGPPQKSDRIVDAGKTLIVQDVETRAMGPGDVLHVLLANG